MMRKQLAVMGVSAALVLGTATVAMAAGGGNGPATNPDCPGDCTGQLVQAQEGARVANTGDVLQLQEQVRTQLQDGTGDQVMEQVQTQARLHEPAGDQAMTMTRAGAQAQDPAGDMVQERTRAMDQDGTCDGTGDPAQSQVRARDHVADGKPSANGQNGGNSDGGGNGK